MRHNIIALSLIMLTLSALEPSHASAQTIDSFKQALETAGLSVTAQEAALDYDATRVDAVKLAIERNGVEVTVEIIEYASQTALEADWIAVNGFGPKPRQDTGEFAGRELYWNHRSVLVADFRAPNDPFLVDLVGDVFLGRLTTSDGKASITPPSTGHGGLWTNNQVE